MDRIPPNNYDAEIAVLGGLLIENSYHDYIDTIKTEYFYKLFHQDVFSAIKKLYQERKNIDILTVTQELKNPVEVTKLTSNIASGIHFPDHLAIIIECYLRRNLIKKSAELLNDSFDMSADVEDLIQNLNATNNELSGLIYKNFDIKNIQEISDLCINDAKERKIRFDKNEPFGISIPLGKLQQITGGWHEGELTFLAARPSMGKTALALKFAIHSAYQGYKVLFISLEMSAKLLVDRIIIGRSGVDGEKYKNGNITNFDIMNITAASTEIQGYNFLIADDGSVSIDQIYTMIKKHRPDIVFIDYIQLVKGSTKVENRNQELGSISRKLKATSKDFHIPVISLAQLNRGVESRTNKHPLLSDLRESGDLEQDADIVMFLYRNSYYNKDDTANVMEIDVKKNRNGRTGFLKCNHNDNFTDFWDIEEF